MKVEADRERIDRAHRFHEEHCPVARSVQDVIDVTTSYELVQV